jgi:hypothetical protein
MSNKKGHLSCGKARPFFKRRDLKFDFFQTFSISNPLSLIRVALPLKTEMDNPSSKFTWSKM